MEMEFELIERVAHLESRWLRFRFWLLLQLMALLELFLVLLRDK